MGVNAELYIGLDEELSDEQIKALEVRLIEEFKIFHLNRNKNLFYKLEEKHKTVIEIDVDRYYGIGYERGWYTRTYNTMQFFRAVFPNCTVYYWPDSWDKPTIFTLEEQEKLWKHYCEVGNNPYIQGFKNA